MKNTHIQNLDNEIPTSLRLEVYKDTLTYFEQNGRNGEGLCLVLPCIMWGHYNYLSKAPDGEYWDWTETQEAFPELGRDISQLYNKKLQGQDIWQIRKTLLKSWIKELSDD